MLDVDIDRLVREQRLLAHPSVLLTYEQRTFIERTGPSICARGGWEYVECAAPPDHVHTLLRADTPVHGKEIRRWFKRWLSEALNDRFGERPAKAAWWAEGGSTKPVKDSEYFANVVRYIRDQRATRETGPTRPGSRGTS